MKIAILSDTHLTDDVPLLQDLMERFFSTMDLIIHCGDYKTKEVLETLSMDKNFIGVWGNVDGEEIREAINKKEIIEVEGVRIGVFHGHGRKGTTMDRAYEAFKSEQVDIIVFGHSHQPMIKTKNKIIFLNPGSITSKRRERWFTYIQLTIENQIIQTELVFFS